LGTTICCSPVTSARTTTSPFLCRTLTVHQK
jgi:hypothetical protein